MSCLFRFSLFPKFPKFSVLIVAAGFCVPAMASSDDVFSPYLDFTVAHEDNLLRFHDSAAAIAVTGSDVMADVIKRTIVGLRINKIVSQQVLSADLSMNRNSYRHFSQYDNDGKSASANWNWHAGSHVEGNLNASYLEAQTPFQDFQTREPNINRQRRENLDASWRFHPSWRVRGAYGRYALAYDLASLSYNDRNLLTSELGLDFLPASNSSVGVQMRHIRGEYPNDMVVSIFSLENSYTQNEFKGKIDWRVTETSGVQFLGGFVKKNYDVLSKRNFSGTNSRLVGNWFASGKLNLGLSIWNELGSTDNLSANYSLSRGIGSTMAWDLLPKVRLDGLLRAEHRNYNSLALASGIPPLERKDTYKIATLGLSYTPVRHFQIGASLSHEILDSNFERYGYRANRFQMSGRYDLGLE